jgi:hypothetical protein
MSTEAGEGGSAPQRVEGATHECRFGSCALWVRWAPAIGWTPLSSFILTLSRSPSNRLTASPPPRRTAPLPRRLPPQPHRTRRDADADAS